MNNYGFIDDGHYGLNKEQMAKLARELQDNNPMQDINKHYDDEINLLTAMMDEMKKQAKDTDKKHIQTITKANWQIFCNECQGDRQLTESTCPVTTFVQNT